MTTTAPTGTTHPAPEKVGRVAIAAGVGTSLEFYDFAIYGTATALVFNQVFFVSDDPWFSSFMGFATFAIGFMMAPIGAAFFGWLGDKVGRRTSLMMTFIAMGAATVLMGVLPSYAAIGIAAPIMLVVLRMFHGLARGGEIGGAAVLAVEHAPPHRRALFGSFVALGSPIGMLLANFAFMMVLLLPSDAVNSYGWRLPFLVGGVVLLLGIWARHGVAESPVFKEMMAAEESQQKIAKAPLLKLLRENWRRVLLAAGVNLGLNAFMFILASFMLAYATAPAPQGLGLDRQPIVWGSLVGLVAHAASVVASAWLSDRIGRKPVMLTGIVAVMAYALVMFQITAIGTLAAVNAAVIIGFFLTGFLFGPLMTYFTELFTAEQRQSGMGIGYQLGAVLGGGLSPMIANRLIEATGSATSVGWYLFAFLAVGLVCLLTLPETAPAKVGVQVPAGRRPLPAAD